MHSIYPENFENKIGFDRVRQMLLASCLSDMGKERVEEMAFSSNYSYINLETDRISEFLIILREYDSFPSSHFYDLRKHLKIISVEGTFIEPEVLFNLRRSLETVRGIVNFFKGDKAERFIRLRELLIDTSLLAKITGDIDRILDKHGKIKDTASPELRDIRNRMFSLQGSIGKKMQQILRQLQAEGIVDEDTTVAIRDGRPVLPVVSANKKKINGIVHDESATGKTSFIEPAEIVEMNNRLRELENSEKREIVKILVVFTDSIRPDADELFSVYDFLGEIDFIRAKAVFANRFECVKPDIRDEPFFDWHQATHPLLVQALAKEKRKMVPLKMRLDEPNRILLISGPNAGGKSVCLKTVGIVQYMLQCGMLPPVSEGSRVGIFSSMFIDIGDEQSIDNDLSTYSSHLLNMKFFIQNCNPKSLVLIDEFGTGTEPLLGGAIAEAVLNRLNQLGTHGIITTHYTNLKHFGSSNKGIVNGAMLYDQGGMRPLFELQIGKPGSSFAFEIARKIGLPEDILAEATDKLGKEHIDYDKSLREIVRDKQYWETKRNRIRKVEKSLDTLSTEYQNELEITQKQRKEIVAAAKREAQKIIDEANKLVENTIREIRESQAEKDKVRIVRQKLIEKKDDLQAENHGNEELIARKIETLQKREEKRRKKKVSKQADGSEASLKTKLKPVFAAGDKIKLKETGSIGEIIDIDKSKVVVSFGNLFSTLTVDKIEPISNNEVKKQQHEERMQPKADSLKRTNKLMEMRLGFKPDIDVRGQRSDEALANIQAFIDEAIMTGSSKVRILHGKGYGILKENIRNYLKSEPAVASIADEHVQFGGAGITVVEFA